MTGWLYVNGPSLLLGAVVAAIACAVAFSVFVLRVARDGRWRR